MLRTLLLFITMMVISICSYTQDTAAIVAKTPVIKASDDDWKDARQKTENLLKDIKQADPLFDRFALTGEGLWNKLKDMPVFQNTAMSNVTFKIPQLDAKGNIIGKTDAVGKVFQEKTDYDNLWSAIQSFFNLSKASAVEMTLADKFVFWQYFAKIEEPVTIIKGEKGRLILKFVKGKLFFIEFAE